MDKIYVVYWSQTGNTQSMAEAIGKGIDENGKEAVVVEVNQIQQSTTSVMSRISIEDLKEASVFALGCPAMGAEVLEESEMEPFVEMIEGFSMGKTIALFGSYSWGDGEWMRQWADRMESSGAKIINGEGLICQDTPDPEMLEQCKQLGNQMAEI